MDELAPVSGFGSVDMKANRKALLDLVGAGYVSANRHPEAQLTIYNYTHRAQYDRHWNKYTEMARGLILDDKDNIVARPFKKFFNLGELSPSAIPKKMRFSIHEKLDGSLGILYFFNGRPYIATRGSFTSDQAIHASQLLQGKYKGWFAMARNFPAGQTYLFEIIYPENRIVVDYGDFDDIVMLAVINNETGKDDRVDFSQFPWPAAKQYHNLSSTGLDKLADIEEDNKEGYVILFENGLRIKIKFGEYLRLHRILTGMNSRRIWEYLKSGGVSEEIFERMPEEFLEWANRIVASLQKEYCRIEDQCKQDFTTLETRKETALYFQKCAYPSILFSMLDRKNYGELIWKTIKPESAEAFKDDIDSLSAGHG